MIYKSKLFQYSIGLLLLLILLSLLKNMAFILEFLKQIFSFILIPLLIGLLFYYILRPIVRFLEKRRVKKCVASIIVSLIVIFLIILVVFYCGTSINNSVNKSCEDMLEEVQKGIEVMEHTFPGVINHNELEGKINIYMRRKLGGSIPGVFSQIANIGTQIILIPFVAFYFLKDDTYFAKRILDKCSDKYKNQVKSLLIDVDNTLSIYITGQLIVALILGLLMYLGFKIIKLPNAALLSFFTMVTNIIPFIGPFIGAVPAVVAALTIDIWMVLKVVVVSIIAQQLEGNIITPHIIGNRLEIHPLMVLIIVFVSISIFGVIGAFIGIPLYAVIKVIVKNLYKIYKIRNIQTHEIK